MKYFIDTEFIESGPGHPIELLSIAVVAEDGREFYGVNSEADTINASEWVKANVLPFLGDGARCNRNGLARYLLALTRDDPKPEFWGWCCGFDYVLVSQLIGFNNWPDGWPYYFRDIQQLADGWGELLTGDNALPEDGHNALSDAKQIQRLYNRLVTPTADWCQCGHRKEDHYEYILNGEPQTRCKGCDPFKERDGGNYAMDHGSWFSAMYHAADHMFSPAAKEVVTDD